MTDQPTIPEIRIALRLEAKELARFAIQIESERLGRIAKNIHMLADATARRAPVQKAKTQSVKVTEALKKQIRAYDKKYPGTSYKCMANHFGVNQGRISEILAGKRGEK